MASGSAAGLITRLLVPAVLVLLPGLVLAVVALVLLALAHLGAVDIALHTARAALEAAAAGIDADPDDRQNGGRRRALRVRALAEATATEVMHRVGRALGASPLSHDEAHGRRVADLTVYIRQHHAERDLAELGALVADAGTAW